MPNSYHLSPQARLVDALADHELVRRRTGQGVCAALLEADAGLWLGVGWAIAELADRVVSASRGSAYGVARPDRQALAVRLSESIDDQVDASAWRVIDAAARLGTEPQR